MAWKIHRLSMTQRPCPQLLPPKAEPTSWAKPSRNRRTQSFVSSTCSSRVSPFFFYIFGGWFSGDGKGGNSGANFITVTVVCILLLAADFWVVKNITGRLLVGLRWWNRVDGDKTTWIFESAKDRHVNKFDSSVFWTVLYGTPFVWGGLMIIGILKFNLGWLITVLTAVALSSANVYGYYKCSSDQKAKFQQMVSEGATRGAMTVMRGNMMGWLTGTSQAPATAPAQPQANSFA